MPTIRKTSYPPPILVIFLLTVSGFSCRPKWDPESNISASGSGGVYIKSIFSQKVLTARGKLDSQGNPAVGDLVEQRTFDQSSKRQLWHLESKGGNQYSLVSAVVAKNGIRMCLETYELPNPEYKDKSDIGAMPCSSTDKQVWLIENKAKGWIKSKYNHMCLSLSEAKHGDGQQILLDHCKNESHRIWQVVDAAPTNSAPATTHRGGLSANGSIVGIHAVSPATTNVVEAVKEVHNLGACAIKVDYDRENSGYQTALNLPFKYYFLWYRSTKSWINGFGPNIKNTEYNETMKFAESLLTKNNGKTFFLGFWEGDWLLLGEGQPDSTPSKISQDAMIEWINTRQKAVDDAKKKHPNSNVRVYTYAEVNRVRDAIEDDSKIRMVNKILPKLNVDYISYSAYDVQQSDKNEIHRTLDYIQGKLQNRPGISGKRVFIGEFGMTHDDKHTAETQDQMNRQMIEKFSSWGAPYILYWNMFDTKTDMEKNRRLGLKNPQKQPSPFYATLKTHYNSQGCR